MTDREITQAAREICAQQALKGFRSDHANYMSGKYDNTVWMRLVELGILRGLEGQSDALHEQLLQECLVKLRDVQGTQAPKQYACNLIKRIERVLQGQSK
jgi:hypothetical protein